MGFFMIAMKLVLGGAGPSAFRAWRAAIADGSFHAPRTVCESCFSGLSTVMCVMWLFALAGSGAQATGNNAQQHAKTALKMTQAGDLPKAESELRLAVQLSPAEPQYLSELAAVLREQKKLAEAIIYYRQALAIDPKNVPLRRNLAQTFWDLGRWQEAKLELQTVLKATPADRLATVMLGMVEERLGEH